MKIALVLLLVSMIAFGKECLIEKREVITAIYGSGQVKSAKQVLIKAGVSGYVKRLYVREGDKVNKNQLLLEIDSSGLENRIRSLSVRINRLREKLREGSPFLKSLENTVKIARENLEKAENRYQRRRRLYQKGVISKEALEEAQRLYNLSLREYETAVAKREEQLRELKAQLKALEEEKKALQKELQKYLIESPLKGVVLKTFVEEGDFVNHIGRDNILLSVGSEEKKVLLRIDEEFAHLLKKGQKVYITTDAYPNSVFEGKVVSYDLESDPTRRTVEVEVKANLPPKLPVNSVVEGNIIVSRLTTTVVPLEAVKDGFAVILIEGEKRKVKVERIFDRYAEIRGYPVGTPCLIEE